MRGRLTRRAGAAAGLAVALLMACGDDEAGRGGNGANFLGVGAECVAAVDCLDDQTCLSFKGGYCGVDDCAGDDDCPSGSACIAHSDGANYCFLVCVDKSDCNANRSVDNESNCSSNIEFVDGKAGRKACVPPS